MRIRRTSLLAGTALLLLAVGVFPGSNLEGLLAPQAAHAQNIGQRIVLGFVSDASSTPVAGATVFLKNLKNKSIRSFTTDPKGQFRFTQVDMAQNHELWAEKDGRKSAVKTVSEWDARKEFETELKLK